MNWLGSTLYGILIGGVLVSCDKRYNAGKCTQMAGYYAIRAISQVEIWIHQFQKRMSINGCGNNSVFSFFDEKYVYFIQDIKSTKQLAVVSHHRPASMDVFAKPMTIVVVLENGERHPLFLSKKEFCYFVVGNELDQAFFRWFIKTYHPEIALSAHFELEFTSYQFINTKVDTRLEPRFKVLFMKDAYKIEKE